MWTKEKSVESFHVWKTCSTSHEDRTSHALTSPPVGKQVDGLPSVCHTGAEQKNLGSVGVNVCLNKICEK